MPDPVERKLAAILSTNVVGYSPEADACSEVRLRLNRIAADRRNLLEWASAMLRMLTRS